MLPLEKFDLEQLAMALENHFEDYETFFWVDPASGSIELWSEGVADEAESEGWDVESRDGVRIDTIDSYEAFRVMERFIATVAESSHRDQLTQAIERSKPFRHFKNAVHQLPDLLPQWYTFHDKVMTVRSIEWLRDNGLVDFSEADAALGKLDAEN